MANFGSITGRLTKKLKGTSAKVDSLASRSMGDREVRGQEIEMEEIMVEGTTRSAASKVAKLDFSKHNGLDDLRGGTVF